MKINTPVLKIMFYDLLKVAIIPSVFIFVSYWTGILIKTKNQGFFATVFEGALLIILVFMFSALVLMLCSLWYNSALDRYVKRIK